jgi:hypothetical protein
MKQKRTHNTIRITAEQYDTLLRLATKRQQKTNTLVTVGMLVREILNKELNIND